MKDPQVETLAIISLALQSDCPDAGKDAWHESPFHWIRARSSRQRGAIGERLVSRYLARQGFEVARSPDSDADRVIAGKRVEIKLSTLWQNGVYRFQQLRDQHYDFVLCLGISPFTAHCWVLPKAELLKGWRNRSRGVTPQHGGKSGADTAWLSVDPENVPEWLSRWGGRLSNEITTQ